MEKENKKEIVKILELESEEWYQALITECKAIITETVFNSRWILLEGYHILGKRILEENKNFERAEIYGKRIANTVGNSLGKSRQTINYAIQFAKKYPSLDALPEGKNISWHKICNKYLPSGGRKECQHELEEVVVWKCKKCNKIIKK